MTPQARRPLVLLLLSFSAAGCGGVVFGDGVAGQEVRALPGFSELEVGDGLRAEIVLQPETGVTLSGDENLLPLVRTDVQGGRLRVGTEPLVHLEPRVPLLLRIGTPALRLVDASGGAEVTGAGVTAADLSLDASGGARLRLTEVRSDRITLSASGAAAVTLTGQGQALTADLSGGAQLTAQALVCQDVSIDGSGAASGSACASRSLHVDLSGASHLDYYCSPGRVEQDLSGASTLSRR